MIGATINTASSRVLPRFASSLQPSSATRASSSVAVAASATPKAKNTKATTTAQTSWGFDYRYGLAMAAGTAAVSSVYYGGEEDVSALNDTRQNGKGNLNQHPLANTASTSTSTTTTTTTIPNQEDNFSLPNFLLLSVSTTACERAAAFQTNQEKEPLSDEETAFLDTIGLYQKWLTEIKKQWAISSPSSIAWPTNIPQVSDISALELDLQNYIKGNQGTSPLCLDLEFRIACYYLFKEASVEQQRKGFIMAQKLAVDGHADGLCLFAMVWNHGGVAGIEAKPHLAVKYWRQAADMGHLASMYELAVALYMGDGAVENTAQAVRYFKKAADLGHSGAAFLLADCYLDGIGVEERSRARAMEWLMAAAEMGHRQAQRRAEALLVADATNAAAATLEEDESIRWGGTRPADWYRKVSLERRFSIGGGSRNPLILFKRRTSVAESRQSEE